MNPPIVAVVDLGKTNKKIALYDAALRPLASRQAVLEAAPDASGVGVEPVAAIWDWLCSELSALYRDTPFAAIAITTHGATWAALDADGQATMPILAYDHALDQHQQQALDERFYALVGSETRVQAETGTCDLPLLINPAKALLFARQHFPAAMARTVRILNYPQYWGHRLTGIAAAEPTYSFNHSFLYDFASRQPSSVARALGVDHLLPRSFRRPWDLLGRLSPGLQLHLGLPALPVAVGIHDSNAALLPYLLAMGGRDFVLDSTGTWCVAMHRVPAPVYEPGELGTKTIFNIDALGGYQKVSFLMGGQDYDLYHQLIGGRHGDGDPSRLAGSLASTDRAILPGAFPSQFPGCSGGARDGERRYTLAELQAGTLPAWFSDRALAHDLLNVSLALQTRVALQRTGIRAGTAVFIEGGFRNNPAYLALLAALLPDHPVACTSLEQATATGTALLGHALLGGGDITALADRVRIAEVPVAAPRLPGLADYAAAWLTEVARAGAEAGAIVA